MLCAAGVARSCGRRGVMAIGSRQPFAGHTKADIVVKIHFDITTTLLRIYKDGLQIEGRPPDPLKLPDTFHVVLCISHDVELIIS